MSRAREFAASRLVMGDGTVWTKCDQCRTMHSERKPPTIPPCDDCRGEELMPENRQAAIIYQLVEGQIITRFNGHHDDIIDLNYGALKTVMDLYEIKDQKMVFEKVRKLFFYFLENRNRE